MASNPERRAIFEQVTKPVKAVVDAVVEEGIQYRLETPSDLRVEITTEGVLVVLAVTTAIKGSQERLVTTTPVAVETIGDNPELLKQKREDLDQAEAGGGKLTSSLSDLGKQWAKSYRRTYTTTHWQKIGDVRVPVSQMHEVWHEPSELTDAGLDRHVISGWVSDAENLHGRFDGARVDVGKAPNISKNGNDSYRFEVEEVDLGTGNTATAVAFGMAATGYGFYEEGVSASAKASGNRYGRAAELSSRNIKRRSFVKLGLGALAMIPVRDMQNKFALLTSGVDAQVRDFTRQALVDYRHMSADDAERVVLGETSQETIGRLQKVADIAGAALKAGTDSTKAFNDVAPAIRKVQQAAMGCRGNIEDGLVYENDKLVLPQDRADTYKSIVTGNRVTEFAGRRNVNATANVIGQAVAFAGGLAAAALTTEGVIYASEKLLEKKSG